MRFNRLLCAAAAACSFFTEAAQAQSCTNPNQQTVTPTSSTVVCAGNATVNVASSQTGVNYYLRNDANDAIIAGPVAGTGSAVSFSTGVISATTTYNVNAAAPTGALDFETDVDNYVSVGTGINSVLAGTNAITVEAWINLESYSFLPTVVSNYDNSDMQFLLRIDNNKPAFWVNSNMSGFQIVQGTSTIPLNKWVHVAGTWDGTDLKVYYNGVLEGTSPVSGSFPFTFNEMRIGAGRLTESFDGEIDNVRIWNTARTATEINNNKWSCLTGSEPNLLALYNFDEGSGTTLFDLTANNYDGTLIASPTWANGTDICSSCQTEMTTKPVVTVNPITNQAPSAAQAAFCPGGSTNITIPSSEGGVNYSLRENTTVIGTAQTGTGTGLSFPTGTITSTKTYNVYATKTSTALDFDGVNDHVAITNGTNIPAGNSNYTIETWIKPDQYGMKGIVGWGTWGTNSTVNALRLDNNNQIVNYWWNNDIVVTAPNLDDGKWHHVAATFDGTTRKMYVDGVLLGSDTPIGHNVTTTNNLKIGTTNNTEYFDGGIDEVRIWNIARTQAQIVGAMSSSLTGQEAGLAAYYTFENGTPSTTLTDVAGGDNTGTLTNMNTATAWTTLAPSCTVQMTPVVTVTVNSITTTGTHTNVSCFGGSNGSATVAASGGTGTYTYSWSPSGGTAATATGRPAGNYTVTITDANGCTGTRTYSITQPTAPVSGTTVVTSVSCFGGTNGTINLTPSGGTGPYTYNWLPSGPTTEDRTGLVAGTYTVQITDANACVGTVTVSVTQPTSPVSGTTVVTSVSCFGGSNGAINLTPSGGTGPYTYNWLPSGPTTEDRTGLVAGTYSVTITDNNGCVATATALVTQPTAPVSGTTVVTSVSCFGGSNGAINLTPSGGTAPYTYNWGSSITTEDRTGLAAGTYTVVITDNKGCTATVTATVTQPTAPVSGSTAVTNVSCFGGSNGAINLTPSGGTVPYTFNWGSAVTTEDRTGLAAGTYTVIITDNNSCTATVTATVTEPAVLTASIMSNNVTCNAGNNGDAMAMPSGGPSSTYTYLWSDGQTTQTATGLMAGSYTVTVTSGACTAAATVTITEPSAITASIMSSNVTCNGDSNGDAMVMPSGGPASTYTYLWSDGQTTQTATGLIAGSYTVTVTSGACTSAATVTITEPSAIATAVSSTDETCSPANDGTATVAAAGGTGMFTYLWSDVNAQTTSTATGLTAGTYTVTVDDGACAAIMMTVTVNASAAPAVTVSHDTTICQGSAATLIAAGGTSYAWDNGAGTNDTVTVMPATSTTYQVTVTDINGCVAASQVIVTVDSLPAASFTYVIPGSLVSFTNTTPNAGSFTWSFGDSTATDTTASPSHTYADGTYVVTLIASNGCGTDTVTDTITVITTGIKPLGSYTITVAPNPSEGIFNVTVNDPAIQGTLSVIDVQGRVIHTGILSSGTQQLNLTHLAKGVYSIRLDAAGMFDVKRVIIQ